MIHNSEDKVIKFTLYKEYEKWRVDKEYQSGDCVWYNDKYYEYKPAVAASTGVAPTVVATWNLLASRKKFATTNIAGMVIVLYYSGSRNIVKQYSLNVSAGFDPIDGSDSANSIYSIVIQSVDTVKKKEGVLMAEIKIKETAVGIGSGFINTIMSAIPVSEVNSPITEFIMVV